MSSAKVDELVDLANELTMWKVRATNAELSVQAFDQQLKARSDELVDAKILLADAKSQIVELENKLDGVRQKLRSLLGKQDSLVAALGSALDLISHLTRLGRPDA